MRGFYLIIGVVWGVIITLPSMTTAKTIALVCILAVAAWRDAGDLIKRTKEPRHDP